MIGRPTVAACCPDLYAAQGALSASAVRPYRGTPQQHLHEGAPSAAVVSHVVLAGALSWRSRCKEAGKAAAVARPAVADQTKSDSKPESRSGFKVNDKYTGRFSYGTVDEDDFEEARRIRASYSSAISGTQESATRKLSDARGRLRRYRYRKGLAGQQPEVIKGVAEGRLSDDAAAEENAASDGELDDDTGPPAASTDGGAAPASEEGDRGEPALSTPATDQARGASPNEAGQVGADGAEDARFPGMADSVAASAPKAWEAQSGFSVSLAFAERMVADTTVRRRSSGAQLMVAAQTLGADGRHADAALLLQHLRDFGVDEDVLQRRLSPSEADALFQEASLRLGLELWRGDYLLEAWAALLSACAEPRLRDPKRAMEALAEVALKLATRDLDPARQVEALQGAADAAAVLQVLSRDRRDELDINLALALQAAGRLGPSREILQALARGAASPRRRKQAEWAMMVQDVDTGEEPLTSTVEMRALWNEGMRGLTFDGRGSGGMAGGASTGAGGVSSGARMGSLSFQQVLPIVAVLLLPLLIPLAGWLKNLSTT